MNTQSKAILKNLRIAPRKVRLVIDGIRGKRVAEALVQLQYSGKQAARPVTKLLRSAIANAKQNHAMNVDTLRIQSATVDGGPVLHRWMPRAFGRAAPIRKRTSHITIVLEEEKSKQKNNPKSEI